MLRFPLSSTEAGVRLDKLLVQKVPGVGRARAKRLFDEGRVRLCAEGEEHGRRVAKGDVAAGSETLEVDLEPEAAGGAALPDPSLPLRVVLETPLVVVVEKPAGQPTAPLEPGELGTLANALVARYPELAGVGFSPREPGLCHRLDTGTTGLLLVARTRAAFEVLSRALKEGRLDKRYLLVCEAADLPEAGTIAIPLAPHPKDRRRVYPCVHPRDVARYAPRPASTDYRVVRVAGRFALVEAKAPKAARHQIRAHFAAIGHPLAGDELYGGPAVPGLGRHALHAAHIGWGGDPVVPAFEAESALPADLAAVLGGVPEA
jgi:23S rRNA pseudouridine1911/1915/1917 synthase